MGFFDRYPYTNWHNVNLDWVLERVKEWGAMVVANDLAFKDLKEANESFKEYVTNYLQDLDVQEEINNKLDSMFESGELTEYLQPYISPVVTTWLDENITEPVGVVIDSSLTVAGAAADSKAAGDQIKNVNDTVLYLGSALTTTVKNAILNCFEHIALWTDPEAQTYIETLRSVFFNQSNITEINVTANITTDIYTIDNINTLRNYITVEVRYSNYTTRILTDSEYILLGTLQAGINTITVFYNGMTAKFNVTVKTLVHAVITDILYDKGITALACTDGTFTTGVRASFSAFVFNSDIKKCYYEKNTNVTAEWVIFREENSGNTLYGFNGTGVSKFEWDGTHYTATGATSQFIIKRGGITVNDDTNKNITLSNNSIRIEGLNGYVTINNANCIGFWQSQGSYYLPVNCFVNEVVG